MTKAFTLIELIVVIIIVGVLAAIGLSQYSLTVEKARTAEAKVRIGAMRQLAHEYYLNNGTMTGITNEYVGADNACSPTDFYKYNINWLGASYVGLTGTRCASGGKTPNTTRVYYYYYWYYPSTGQGTWHCFYSDDSSGCFGLSHH